MDKIRIAQLIHGEHFGGAEKVFYQICEGLDRDRFEPVCITLADGYLNELCRKAGIETHLVPMRSKIDFTVIRPIVKILKQSKRTIIHSHTSRSNLLGRISSRLAGVRNISTIHSPIDKDTNVSLEHKPVNAFVEKLSRYMLDTYTSVSMNVYNQIVAEGFNKEKIHYVPNGADVNIEPMTDEEKKSLKQDLGINDEIVIAMIAQLRPRKGCEYFIKAMPKIIDRYQNVKFLIVGNADFVEDRDYLGELKSLAKELGVSEQINFTGFRDDVRKIMQIIDVDVLPSLFGEGLPLTLLEAMACAVPVVVTDTEGNNEAVVDKESGYLVPPEDAGVLSERVCELIGNSELRFSMGGNARSRIIEHFSLESMIRKYESIYSNLIQ